MRIIYALLIAVLLASPVHAAVTGWSTANYLRRLSAVWPGQLPFLISVWVNTPTGATVRNVTALGVSGSDQQMRRIYHETTNAVVAQSRTTSGVNAVSTGTVANSTWTHLAAAFVSTNSRAIYLNAAKNVNTTSLTVTAPNALYIGVTPTPVSSFASAGGIAEISIWDLAGFTETERDNLVTELATLDPTNAPNPLAVNAQGGQPWTGTLVAYWRLTDHTDLIDLAGNGHDLSLVGTLSAFASHPPVDAVPVAGGARAVIID